MMVALALAWLIMYDTAALRRHPLPCATIAGPVVSDEFSMEGATPILSVWFQTRGENGETK